MSKVTIRNVYGREKRYFLQPCKQKNGTNFPFVKKVRYNDNGDISQIETKDNFLKESTYQDFRYYDNDENGNWTRRETIFMQGRLQ